MFSKLKLGLRPHDPERVGRVAKFSGSLLPVDPLMSSTPADWSLGRVWDGDILDNDVLGNCGPAAVIHWLRLMALAAGRTDLRFTVQDVLDLYTAMGYNGTTESDNGVVLLDLMEYMRRVGVRGFRFEGFFSVGFADSEHLATALYVAPLLIGASLSVACQNTDTWDATAALDGKDWGGHAYLAHSYSPGGCNGASWGAPVWTEPVFQRTRWTEAYLPICPELMPGRDVERLLTLAGQL